MYVPNLLNHLYTRGISKSHIVGALGQLWAIVAKARFVARVASVLCTANAGVGWKFTGVAFAAALCFGVLTVTGHFNPMLRDN